MINSQKINKSVGSLLRTSKNLQLITNDKNINLEHDICCGLGRKVIYFSKGNGIPTKIKKYPFLFGNTLVNNKEEFEEVLTAYFGVGYITYVINSGNAVVLGASYKKNSDGTLPIADYVVI